MTNLRNRPKLPRRQILIRFFEELIYSAAIWLGVLVAGIDPERYIYFTGGWIAMSFLTAISGYTGQMARMECKDLRFIWFSLHNKIPEWLLWIFWPTVAAVLISPLFAIFAYIAVGLAFYRGFWFSRHCMGYRFITFIDICIRGLAGIMIGLSI
ncbi:hypothetical protein K8T06_11105 [bacterium]|nr:hypothetical protein [bacterium]